MKILIYYDYTHKDTFHNISHFEEKIAGISFRDSENDYWFITYNAFFSFILMEDDKNDI